MSRAKTQSDLSLPQFITEWAEGTIGHTVLSVSWQPWTLSHQTACARLRSAVLAFPVSLLSQDKANLWATAGPPIVTRIRFRGPGTSTDGSGLPLWPWGASWFICCQLSSLAD